MFKKLSALFILFSVLLTVISCSDNKNQHQNYGYSAYDYDPYSSHYYNQDRYYDYRSERHQIDCVYDDNYSSYKMRKYRDYNYSNQSCSKVNNFVTNYNNYGFTPYYMTSGCPTGYYQVYYGYSLFCSPANYYNYYNNYISTNAYIGFGAWWLAVGLYLSF